MEQTIVHAILSGDPKVIFGAAAALLLTFFAGKLGIWIGQLGADAADKLKAWWDPLTAGKLGGHLQAIGDAFIDKIRIALSNQTHLNATVATSVADGTISDSEWAALAGAAFEDVKANLGVHEWSDLALLLTGKKDKAAPGLEAAVKARFMANVRTIAGAVCEDQVTQRTMRQAQRAMTVAGIARDFPGTNLGQAFPRAAVVTPPDLGNSFGSCCEK